MSLSQHPALARLVGRWCGRGRAVYPHVTLDYFEETSFVAKGAWPLVHVVQKTWLDAGDGAKGRGIHFETGIVRVRDDGALLYSCAQDNGRTEVMVAAPEATAAGELLLRWVTTAHGNDERLVKMGRDWRVSDTDLAYEAYVSTARTPEYRRHLECRMKRVG